MNRNGPRFSNPRRPGRPDEGSTVRQSRLLLIVGLFLVLIPVAGIIRGSDGHVVNAGVLPGAVGRRRSDRGLDEHHPGRRLPRSGHDDAGAGHDRARPGLVAGGLDGRLRPEPPVRHRLAVHDG